MVYNDEKTIQDEMDWHRLEEEYKRNDEKIAKLDEKAMKKFEILLSNLNKFLGDSPNYIGLKTAFQNYIGSQNNFKFSSKFFFPQTSIILQDIFDLLKILFVIYDKEKNIEQKKHIFSVMQALMTIGIDVNKIKKKW